MTTAPATLARTNGREAVSQTVDRSCSDEAAAQIRQAVENAPEYEVGKPEIRECGDFDRAFYAAVAAAKPGDTVLMSPASAAFDQFKNFMVRGDHFKKLVMEL